MPLDTNSNKFIISFLVIMVLVVSISLSFVATGLKPIIDKNIMVDKKKKILKSVVLKSEKEEKEFFTPDFVLSEYNKKVTPVVIDYQGNVMEGIDAFEVNVKKESKKPLEERKLPVFTYEDGGKKYYIIPLIGLGLWDEINGYLAMENDLNTIKGTAFDHVGETPGLGAEIARSWFNQQFTGEKLMEEDGDYAFTVLKGQGNDAAETSEYKVDGISGATITSQGVDKMIKECVEDYLPYFEKIKNQRS